MGVRVGVDPGTVRVGVAASDRDGTLAFPVATVDATSEDAMTQLCAIVRDNEAVTVYVGLPRSLDGTERAAATHARALAADLSRHSTVPVHLVDERLTTVTASQQLRDAGRSTRQQRRIADQAAAVVLLQAALDIERATDERAGELVQP